jgi:hypothetical protein
VSLFHRFHCNLILGCHEDLSFNSLAFPRFQILGGKKKEKRKEKKKKQSPTVLTYGVEDFYGLKNFGFAYFVLGAFKDFSFPCSNCY